ncbi:U6 snRNA phosphodiesterase Usb1 [Xylaria nigripes]|nr:U6 snRNA phosphodiesterase Usb1 [Xylaria nigripes]
MALVDYSSDTSSSVSSESANVGTNPKRQKTSHGEDELPPLPPAFHDLYASTVRVSASDDPALHQGRKRVNPHKVGNWPSHVYIEWHPSPAERQTLTHHLSNLQEALTSLTSPISLTSFLTSDLGAPQPLHISLSRPIVLSTSQKATFQSKLESQIRETGIAPFDLAAQGVEWHRTAESARSFLVLRVKAPGGDEKSLANPQLASLLGRINTVVMEFGQPALYAADNTSSKGGDASGNSSDVHKAFHISIAWSFASPTAELRRATDAAFFEDKGARDEIGAMRVRVDGIKSKIGNVVTHVPLSAARVRRNSGGGRALFGVV